MQTILNILLITLGFLVLIAGLYTLFVLKFKEFFDNFDDVNW